MIDWLGLVFFITMPLVVYTGALVLLYVRAGQRLGWVRELTLAAGVGILMGIVFWLFQPVA